jgi:signal transduction histidine kinase
LFKAVRELLFNVVKHAGTQEATVFIGWEDNLLKLEVQDRGRGVSRMVDDSLINMGKGMGLFGIKERLRDVDGEIHIVSTPGDCTRVMLQVPIGDLSQAGNK